MELIIGVYILIGIITAVCLTEPNSKAFFIIICWPFVWIICFLKGAHDFFMDLEL